jgi:lauroyl/myristoyl acyltransferase
MTESIPQQAQTQKRPAPWARLFTRYSPGLKYWGFRGFSHLSGLLPLRVSYMIAGLIGDFIYYTWHEHSANAVSNMRRVLGPGAGERAARHAARVSFRNYAKTLADFIRFPHVTPEEIDRRIPHPGGLDHLERARAGKGVLVVTGHLGNWDFAGGFMGRRGLPLYALADPFDPPKLDELVVETRRRNGIEAIKLEAGAMRTIFAALRRNEIVVLLVDRPMPGEGIPVQFFGETAWLPSGPAAIALKTGASIVMGYCIRLPDQIHFEGALLPALDYRSLLTGNKDADTQMITQCIATAMEALIRRAPAQWYMFRPMWPRPATTREHRHAARLRRRQARRQFYARRMGYAQQSLSRLRARLRRSQPAASPDMAGLAMGISVDPPELEEWVAQGPQEH